MNGLVSIMSYAFVGYAMYERGYTKERLDNIDNFDFLMLKNEFEMWATEHLKNYKRYKNKQ